MDRTTIVLSVILAAVLAHALNPAKEEPQEYHVPERPAVPAADYLTGTVATNAAIGTPIWGGAGLKSLSVRPAS
jgi:hypothetical protein